MQIISRLKRLFERSWQKRAFLMMLWTNKMTTPQSNQRQFSGILNYKTVLLKEILMGVKGKS